MRRGRVWASWSSSAPASSLGRRGRLVVIGFLAEGAYALAELAEDVRELPRPEDDEHDDQQENELGTAEVEGHASLPSKGLPPQHHGRIPRPDYFRQCTTAPQPNNPVRRVRKSGIITRSASAGR